jgi:hypothetical protein
VRAEEAHGERPAGTEAVAVARGNRIDPLEEPITEEERQDGGRDEEQAEEEPAPFAVETGPAKKGDQRPRRATKTPSTTPERRTTSRWGHLGDRKRRR